MIGIAITLVILCFVFMIALLVGVIAFGISIAPLVVEMALTILAVRWLLYEFGNH